MVVRSAEYETGLNSSTELFVEQLRELGLDATAQLVGVAEYFEPAGIAAAVAFPLSVIFNRAAAFPSLAFPDPELETALATAAARGRRRSPRRKAALGLDRPLAERYG